ncbi:MAG: glucose PTS transporter subunit IIA [Bifidobacteriaceae bacterium]|jgi:PTS system sucrose-specific IIC component|nr:glucose PTS transporter subunit IIA [Bifidobacteriaceae bacterium]
MATDYASIGDKIYEKIGGISNVKKVYYCMTRVRVQLHNLDKVDDNAIKAVDGVLGLVRDADTIQVIVGPGKSVKIAEAMAKKAGVKTGEEIKQSGLNNPDELDVKSLAAKTKADIKSKQKQSKAKAALKIISAVFIPLIPGMVGAGLIAGIGSVLSNMITGHQISGEPWMTIVMLTSLVQKSFFAYLVIFCGINAAKEFGGTPVIGGIVGSLTLLTGLSGDNAITNIFDGKPLQAGYGGIIAVLVAVWLSSLLEKFCRKWVPDAVDIIITPTIVLLVMTGVQILLIMPLAGTVSYWLVFVINWVLNVGGAFSGFVLGATFLPMVMLGLHQILTPIHLEMISSLGFTPLLPVLAMAGAGQVGAAFGLIIRCKKNKELMNLIKGALPVGILGIGEPLIYGVTLPLGRPFITACLGGGIGGAVIGGMPGMIGSTAIGPSGVALIPLIADGRWLGYIAGLLSAYLGGMLLTAFFGIPKDIKGVKTSETIYSVADGEVVDLQNVPDKTFSEKIMGEGVAVKLNDRKIVAPADGVITSFLDSYHAFTLTTDKGINILVHIGIDTVKLAGEGFKPFVKQGDKVKKGQTVLEVNLDFLREKGFDTITPIILLDLEKDVKVKEHLGDAKAGKTPVINI